LPDVNLNLSGVTAEFIPTAEISTDNDLEIHLNQNQKGISGYFVYNKALFHKIRIEKMAEHFINILKNISTVNKKVGDINLLSEEEKHYILYDLNSSFIDYSKNKSVCDLFEDQVSKTPNCDAVVYKNNKISYKELNDRANQLAYFLKENGAEKEIVIALMLHRSIEMMVGLYGILKSGCAYLPIDPEYPQERISYMLENSNAKILITDNELKKRVSNSKIDIININESKIFENEPHNQSKDFSKDIAYLIYTSGSTGTPKGIMVEHRNVVNFILGVTNKVPFESGKTILSLTTISFDIFVLETFLSLSKGLRVIMGSSEEQTDPTRMAEVIQKYNVEMLQFTPSRLKMILDSGKGKEIFGNIKELMVGGEAFPLELLKDLKKNYKGRIFNMYGPTETTVWSSIKELTNEESITLGEPIANTQIYILDKNNEIKPLGVQGELCIGGDGVARGYWKLDELTRQKFINNPFVEGGRIYKTGDLVVRKFDGTLDFVGRMDDQVKIRGYRIELSEIDLVLLNHESIDDAAVVVKEDSNKNKILCAYYVSASDLFADELREFLLKKLPGYMVPGYFIRLEKMPMTSNGKIDKKSFPEFSREKLSLTNNYEEPKNNSEKTIIDIWKEILNLQSVGVNDNFFDVGGHSLLIAKLTHLIKVRTGIELDDMDIFRYPTIRLISNNYFKQQEEDKRINSTINTGESKKILLDKILGNRKNK
jgi:amino acid adenylation domain-containing protein